MAIRKSGKDQAGDWPAGLSAPARRALHEAGYSRLEDLAGVSARELHRLHGMGPKALAMLRQGLAEKGLSFAAEEVNR